MEEKVDIQSQGCKCKVEMLLMGYDSKIYQMKKDIFQQ